MKKEKIIKLVIAIVIVVTLPLMLFLAKQVQDNRSRAATPDQLETEGGVLSSSGASKQSDSAASGSQYVLFSQSVSPTPALTLSPAGTTYSATTSDQVMALLNRNDLGANPIIQVTGTGTLAPLNLGPAQSGKNGTRTTVDFGGRTISLGGSSCCGVGLFMNGATDLVLRNFKICCGSSDQDGAITIGSSLNPPPTRRVRFTNFEILPTVTGPGTMSSTNNATAHGVYISRATGAHEDIEIDHFIAHADGNGLESMIHLYDGAGTTQITRLHVHDGQMFGFVQTIMAWEEGVGALSGTADDAVFEDLTITGSGQYGLRLPYGNGIVRRTTITGTVSGVNVAPGTGSGWTIQP